MAADSKIERLAGTRLRHLPSRAGLTTMTKAGPVWNGKISLNHDWLDQPLRWKRPRRIFVCAHGDLFHDGVPDDFIAQVWDTMEGASHHTFQILTKRPARMRALLRDTRRFPPLAHVWLGTSVENQEWADRRRDDLAALAAAGWNTFVSYEPALGPIDWRGWEFLGWLISGGESGPKARPSHPDWHRAARDFCTAQGIPYFFKQWGEFTEVDGPHCRAPCAMREGDAWIESDGRLVKRDRESNLTRSVYKTSVMRRLGKSRAGRLLDGREWNEMPR